MNKLIVLYNFRTVRNLCGATAALLLACSTASANPLHYTKLVLLNGWARYSTDLANPSAAVDGAGIVHLRGALGSGTASLICVLPINLRPNRIVYVTADMVNATTGRLEIAPDGSIYAQDTNGLNDAKSFTSLDGVTFSKN